MKPVLIIQNDALEGAGQLGSLLHTRGYQQAVMLGWEADYGLLKPSDFSGLVVLGGAQGVYEAQAYPYLLDEIKLIQSFIGMALPCIGLCLGAQLIAAALGGEVKQNATRELGWHGITLSEAARSDAVMSAHPQTAPAFHFHGDFFQLPPECTGLASSALTGCQLFRYRKNVYGFQYHAEIDPQLLEVMCQSNADYMKANGADADAVIEQSQPLLEAYMQRCAVVLNAWIDLMEDAE